MNFINFLLFLKRRFVDPWEISIPNILYNSAKVSKEWEWVWRCWQSPVLCPLGFPKTQNLSPLSLSQQTLKKKWVELRSLHLQEQRLLHGKLNFLPGNHILVTPSQHFCLQIFSEHHYYSKSLLSTNEGYWSVFCWDERWGNSTWRRLSHSTLFSIHTTYAYENTHGHRIVHILEEVIKGCRRARGYIACHLYHISQWIRLLRTSLAGAIHTGITVYFLGRATTVFQIPLFIYAENLRTKTECKMIMLRCICSLCILKQGVESSQLACSLLCHLRCELLF